MDTSIIDQLYEIYKNENLTYAENMFIQYYKKYQLFGNKDFISNINEYIKQQTALVSNYFVSNKDELFLEQNIVKAIEYIFESLVMPVDFLLGDYIYSDDIDEELVDPDEPVHSLKPHDLFTINISIIDKAVETYGSEYETEYKKIRDLILYVKKNKILNKIYKDQSWHEISFQDLIYSIYDYVDDKSIFNLDIAMLDKDATLFQKIKTNCSYMLSGNFDKYRPNLNSSKQIRADFGKLIFCKNLLLFYEFGKMPDFNGFIDFSINDLEKIDMLENFQRLYSRNFDEISFREHQLNYICTPDIYGDEYKIEAGRKVRQGNKLILGYIVSCNNDMCYNQHCYLIHIEIDDVNNQYSNYEMQVSLLPQGEFDNRLQLMRLDNWESRQSHRNIAKKLSTTTHIHIYNEFDLLRGKTNGAFDIAYNIEGDSTAFETSLRTFLKILDLNDEITQTIYQHTMNNFAVGEEIALEDENNLKIS